MEILKTENLTKTYGEAEGEFNALNNINLSVEEGEFIAIIGKSGSGKSTLLNILGGLDVPSSGKIYIKNENIYNLKGEELTIYRRKNIGIIYQFYNLIPVLTVKENILLPSLLDGRKVKDYYINDIIDTLDLKERQNHLPNELSGGQQQKTAIGRALINKPAIVLADEPTGNLDSQSVKNVMDKLKFYNSKGQTIIMVTHDLQIAKQAQRIITIEDGRIIKDEINGH